MPSPALRALQQRRGAPAGEAAARRVLSSDDVDALVAARAAPTPWSDAGRWPDDVTPRAAFGSATTTTAAAAEALRALGARTASATDNRSP